MGMNCRCHLSFSFDVVVLYIAIIEYIIFQQIKMAEKFHTLSCVFLLIRSPLGSVSCMNL